jgi:spore coat polysaccharide biosynthesis predicted glycosyltransferase SpsG
LKNFLILTEAGNKIGFGHLTRCQALYKQLKKKSYNVDFFVSLNDVIIENSFFDIVDWLDLQPFFFIDKYSVLIIDSYIVSESWLSGFKDKNIVVVHIDDYNRITYPVNLILNPNVYGNSIDYKNQTAKFIGGPDYLILRDPFRHGEVKSNYKGTPRLLITLGGSDYRNMLPRLIDWSTDLNLFKISVIAPEGLELSSKGVRVLPLLDANLMANEIINSEVIISACGQTLHEIASINRSTIGIGIDIDQIPNHKFYNSMNFINRNLWWNQKDLEEEVKNELIRLANSSNRDEELKKSFKINKGGVKNVVNEIIKLL